MSTKIKEKWDEWLVSLFELSLDAGLVIILALMLKAVEYVSGLLNVEGRIHIFIASFFLSAATVWLVCKNKFK
ncbi:MAG: hypothetical protein JOZ02_17230 [Acidobacteria bacterium]|nr:hypothetical protein [Acidobacteriota bacterium]